MIKKLIAGLLLAGALMGCTNDPMQNQGLLGGAAVGALAGQLIGGNTT